MVKEQQNGKSCWRCWMDGQTVEASIRLMPGEGDLCAAHAGDMAIQLLALPSVTQALARRETAVLVLDDSKGHEEVQFLQLICTNADHLPTGRTEQYRRRLSTWCNDEMEALHTEREPGET